MLLAFIGCVTGMGALAAAVTMSVTATVIEVQCTPEQATRIRACAKPTVTVSQQPLRAMSINEQGKATITVDQTRQVIVKTLEY